MTAWSAWVRRLRDGAQSSGSERGTLSGMPEQMTTTREHTFHVTRELQDAALWEVFVMFALAPVAVVAVCVSVELLGPVGMGLLLALWGVIGRRLWRMLPAGRPHGRRLRRLGRAAVLLVGLGICTGWATGEGLLMLPPLLLLSWALAGVSVQTIRPALWVRRLWVILLGGLASGAVVAAFLIDLGARAELAGLADDWRVTRFMTEVFALSRMMGCLAVAGLCVAAMLDAVLRTCGSSLSPTQESALRERLGRLGLTSTSPAPDGFVCAGEVGPVTAQVAVSLTQAPQQLHLSVTLPGVPPALQIHRASRGRAGDVQIGNPVLDAVLCVRGVADASWLAPHSAELMEVFHQNPSARLEDGQLRVTYQSLDAITLDAQIRAALALGELLQRQRPQARIAGAAAERSRQGSRS